MAKIEISFPKCHGEGLVPHAVSRGHAGSVCFECMGAKIIKIEDPVTAAKKEAARQEREAKRINVRNATRGPLIACYALTYLAGTWQAMTLQSYYDISDAIEHADRLRRSNPNRPNDWTIQDSHNYADMII